MGWYEDMEQAEQEYDAKLEDEARAYQQGRADAIDEAIKKLAESEDTILSDRQYYILMELKDSK